MTAPVIAWNLPDDRPGTAADAALRDRRALLAGAQPPELEPGVARTDITRGGLPCIACTPPDATGTILYLHGGGYRLGTAAMWVKFASRLARATSATVEILDYRLAPEHPFPAAVRDAVSAYAELLAAGGPVIVAGDSAGGGLAAAVAVACTRAEATPPRGLVLLSPWVDLAITATTYATHDDRDRLFPRAAALEAAALYLQGHPADDPLASPLRADGGTFPPTLIFAGGDEVLLGDAVALAGQLAISGVSVDAHFVAGMQHVWPTTDLELPEAQDALATIVRFVQRVIA